MRCGRKGAYRACDQRADCRRRELGKPDCRNEVVDRRSVHSRRHRGPEQFRGKVICSAETEAAESEAPPSEACRCQEAHADGPGAGRGAGQRLSEEGRERAFESRQRRGDLRYRAAGYRRDRGGVLSKADHALTKATRARDAAGITAASEKIQQLRRQGNELLVRLGGKARLPIDKAERMR